MDSMAPDSLSNFSWEKEGSPDDISFENTALVPKKQVSALKNARFQSTKIYNIFLLVAAKANGKEFIQVSLKLPLESTIQDTMVEIFTAFDVLLMKLNSTFSLVDDTTLWEMRVAKKTGQPKDYIPAIDPLNLVKSVECYDSLVLCPLSMNECIKLTSSSTFANTNQGNSLTESFIDHSLKGRCQFNEKDQQKDKKKNNLSALSSFEGETNGSSSATSSGSHKNKLINAKNNVSSYSSRRFLNEEEQDDDEDETSHALSVKNTRKISSTICAKSSSKAATSLLSKKKTGFFSFLCC